MKQLFGVLGVAGHLALRSAENISRLCENSRDEKWLTICPPLTTLCELISMVRIMRWIVLLSLLLPRILCSQLATNGFGSATSVATDDGAVIHCWVSGPEHSPLSPVFFIPGYLMPGDIFKFQIRHFKKNRRIVAMDPRSQGQSSRVS